MKYFGTDGIRGKVNEVITNELAYKLGKALSVLKIKTVVIASDTRESKDELVASVAKGASSVGIGVIIAGVVPTPALIYYSKIKSILGVMITASHNPYYDNGLKVLNCGVKLSKEEETLVEKAIDSNLEESLTVGSIIKSDEVKDYYLNFLNEIEVKTNKKIVIDCANGATFQTAEKVFNNACSNLIVTANKPNGTNINNGVGSTHLEHIKNVMKENNSKYGFAFDGDGDRVLAIDENLNVIDGDLIIYIIAKYFYSNNMLNKNTVVFTKMSNLGIIESLENSGIKVVLTEVGDKHVVRELMTNSYSLGGENSGHIIMPDILNTGCGTLVALYLLKIIEETNKTLHELVSDVEMYCDKLVNLKIKNKDVINNDLVKEKITEFENKFGSKGKIVLRASGTENLVRVTVMAKLKEDVEKYSNELVTLLNTLDK